MLTPAIFAQQPQRLAPDALGQDSRVTLTPAFTPDGKTLYFAQSECSPIWECPQRLKTSTLGPTGWSAPQRLPLPQDGRADWPSVSADGSLLLFSWAVKRPRHRGENVDTDFDLYTLRLDQVGALPQPLDEPGINRIRGGKVRTLRFVNNETAPTLTQSGDLYFWTERLDGIGRRDVYLARSNGEGGFLEPEPLPPPINSPADDAGVWVSPNGRLMLVNYSDRGGQGGNDIFVSSLNVGRWATPEALGSAVNSPFEDFSARLTPDAASLVFTSNRPLSVEKAEGNEPILQVWTISTSQVPVLSKHLALSGIGSG